MAGVSDASAAGGRGGGIWLSTLAEPVVTSPGEFAPAPREQQRPVAADRLAIDPRQPVDLALAGVATE